MELLLIFTGAFMVALSGALMPGPLLTLTIAHSLKKGFIAGPLVIFGHMLLEIILVIGVVFGLQVYLQTEGVLRIIFIVGGAILIGMGAEMIINHKKVFLKVEKNKPHKIQNNSILAGIIISLSNPYWTIWWVTIGVGYILKALKYRVWGLTAFFLGHILADFLWYSSISLSISKGRKMIKNSTYQKILLFCGFFLICFGIWFLYDGIT